MIWREGDSFLIKDLNSQNGTWVGGQRVRETTLRHDVCIAAGRTLFMFSEHPLPASTGLKPLAPQRVAVVALPATLAAPAPHEALTRPAGGVAGG